MSEPDSDDFQTKCPKCDGELFVVAGSFTSRIPLYPSGFSTEDAKFFDTENEIVECDSCKYRGPLTMVGDEGDESPPRRTMEENGAIMAHYNLSDEEWDSLSREVKDKLARLMTPNHQKGWPTKAPKTRKSR